jgi:hypothetical protein
VRDFAGGPDGRLIERCKSNTIKGRNVIISKNKFVDDEFATARFEDVAADPPRLRTWSIRAIADEASPPTREELSRRKDWAGAETIYRSWRLLEGSLTVLAGNPNCQTIGVERGAPVLTDAELEPAFRNVVRSGWYCVEEIASGRIVGSYAELSTADAHVNHLNIKAIRAALALARHAQWHSQALRAAVPPRRA